MLSPWLELPGVAEQLARYGELAQLDLTRLGTTAGAEEIVDTAVTQPLIVAAGLITAGQLGLADLAPDSVLSAGHSIGEVTAAAVAGALTDEAAMVFAARRGREMAAACELTPTTMAAALGGTEETVVAAIVGARCVPANRNGAGQIVAAGSRENIQKLVDNPPAGVRFRTLAVAGAFHTEYMAPAEQALRGVEVELADPRQILLSNADGTTVSSGKVMLNRLIAQVTRPVRWDLCLSTMRSVGVSATIELCPAKTLTGIAKRELPDVQLLAIKTPDDLAAARQLLGQAAPRTPGPDGIEIFSSAQGIFTRAQGLAAGTAVRAGCRIGSIRTNADDIAVVAPASGTLSAWLRHDGDMLEAGLPVARLA